MGWTAGVSLEEGIRQAYDWYLATKVLLERCKAART
jgi:nucleoside-diphosphate-sugar epimerase